MPLVTAINVPHSQCSIEQEIDNAEQIIAQQGSVYPDATFEDGVAEALRWILGRVPPPMSDAFSTQEQ
ncbi:Elongation factor 4-Ribosomal back-translocase LepA [Moritella viscosa]|uniref:hypothetical protein n=1 Tax=Moritella viscosa TaxID=80854 RepID=UPI000508FF6D|nr:hypothetical protein [Moritella viscosa]CED61160.1 putative uncharacterized phage gene [Moritella viscosa]SHO20129.1 Elongation factor 4-Ribosomal back-translocase LepA [Moritella viscosa]